MSEEVREGGCHCGGVRFRVVLPDGLGRPRRCNCSYCSMKGAVAVMAPVGGLELLQGEDLISSYRFNTGVAQHFFCSRCGVHTHNRRRVNPGEFGINVACLDGVSPYDFSEVPVNDGVNHAMDTGRPSGIAGVLRYEAIRE